MCFILCHFYAKNKKNLPYNWKPIKHRLVQEIIYLAVTIYQLLRYGWILCFCILFRYKLLNLNCSPYIYISCNVCDDFSVRNKYRSKEMHCKKKHLWRKENDLKRRSTTLHKNRTNREIKHQQEITILLLNL